jgi:hypothetical protein
MRRWTITASVALALLLTAGVADAAKGAKGQAFEKGSPDIESISALAFGPDAVLFVGDGKGGAIYAIDLGKQKAPAENVSLGVKDVEADIAAFLGGDREDVLIHDMAVHPVSQKIYLAVSRGRTRWDTRWLLPNDIADARILLSVDAAGKLDEVPLKNVRYARIALPNPVDAAKKHMWKEGISLRADTITNMAYDSGTLYVAGLSNEEFASTMWRIAYPFDDSAAATTLEIFHGAHGAYETHAPIRAFVPYRLNNRSHLLAAYLCTPLVTFETDRLKDGEHVKGRTVGEFGSGNYPLDMVVVQKDGQDRLVIANSNMPFMVVDPKDIESFEGQITEEVEGYTAGVRYEVRSGTGVQQLARLNDEFLVALQRLPGGTMDLVSLPVKRF